MGVTKKHRVQFYGGTIVDVCMILRVCGLNLKDIQFARAILERGVLKYELYVDDSVKKYLDILKQKSLVMNMKETA